MGTRKLFPVFRLYKLLTVMMWGMSNSSFTVIETQNAPAPVGSYSQAVVVNGIVHVSGQIAINPSTGDLITESYDAEARQVMANVSAVIQAAGATMKDVYKVTIFLTDMARFAEFDAIYSEYLSDPFPARGVLGVASLPKGVAVEVMAEARLS